MKHPSLLPGNNLSIVEKVQDLDSIDEVSVSVNELLLNVVSGINHEFTTMLANYKLNQSRFKALQFIVSGKDITPTKVAAELNVTQATMTGVLQSMEKDGYLARARSDKDSRSFYIFPTMLAHEVVKEVDRAWKALVSKKWKTLSPKELDDLQYYLIKLSEV